MAVISLGYVVIEAQDLGHWQDFACTIAGLMTTPSPREDVALFRMDDRPYRLWVEKGEQNRFIAPGWECANREDFESLLERLEAAGRPVTRAGVMEARARQVYELARSSDPAGNAMEIFYGRFVDYAPFTSPAGVSRFVTGDNGDMGMGHVVLTAPNFNETHAFYKAVMGFGDTDLGRFYLQGGGEDDPGVGFAFLHCNARHHSLALGQMPESPNGAVHMMLEVGSLEDVGRAYDRVLKSKGKVPLSASLGRHVNDKMTSFYMQTPSGFDIEYGWNGLVIDPATWVPTTSLAVSDWGHKWAHEQD
ncbi:MULTISPECIES: VOC family protein [Sphingobium]|uniref:VOC family protein n=1 Tax=Sphingobium tyrosinilyticum TaxID=2715436 RepID=A0ABV9EYZ4_9SPHN|nr:VOC family protein [Sphingobium sp. EP60837]ANI79774.1 3,4-dihydroxy-9,10-secoandrosta-1,3,5(10)-triene-9,17-dione 4,5-dioxygenase [Sphingobium sp. EP60837]